MSLVVLFIFILEPCVRPLISGKLQCSALKSCGKNIISLWARKSSPDTALFQFGVGPTIAMDRMLGSQIPQMKSSLHCAGNKALVHVERETGDAPWKLSAPETSLGLPQVEHPDVAVGEAAHHDLAVVTTSHRPAIVLPTLILLPWEQKKVSLLDGENVFFLLKSQLLPRSCVWLIAFGIYKIKTCQFQQSVLLCYLPLTEAPAKKKRLCSKGILA